MAAGRQASGAMPTDCASSASASAAPATDVADAMEQYADGVVDEAALMEALVDGDAAADKTSIPVDAAPRSEAEARTVDASGVELLEVGGDSPAPAPAPASAD